MTYGQLQRLRRIMRRIQGKNLRTIYGGHYMPLYAGFFAETRKYTYNT
jgi:hypothetical protein